MDAFAHQVAQCGIDHSLTLDAAFSGDGEAFDRYAEMALARGIMAAVSAMLLAVVHELDLRRRERRVEPPEHLACNRTGFFGFHRVYIGGFSKRGSVATRQSRLHGRLEGARARC